MRERKVQRARCYMLGETAVVLELEPPVTLESQKRIWRLAQRLADHEEVLDAIPGMNNITVVLRHPQTMAWDAIEQLQRWWEESEALEPQSRLMTIPVIYGGEDGLDVGREAVELLRRACAAHDLQRVHRKVRIPGEGAQAVVERIAEAVARKRLERELAVDGELEHGRGEQMVAFDRKARFGEALEELEELLKTVKK